MWFHWGHISLLSCDFWLGWWNLNFTSVCSSLIGTDAEHGFVFTGHLEAAMPTTPPPLPPSPPPPPPPPHHHHYHHHRCYPFFSWELFAHFTISFIDWFDWVVVLFVLVLFMFQVLLRCGASKDFLLCWRLPLRSFLLLCNVLISWNLIGQLLVLFLSDCSHSQKVLTTPISWRVSLLTPLLVWEF